MSYDIEITGTTYSYYTRAGVTPTGGEYGGEWMDGDRRELASDSKTITMDEDDHEFWDVPGRASHVPWAVFVIDTTTDAVHPSSSPIGDTVREHEWLSGSYTDPYDNSKITETSVRLTGDWTDEERALVFKSITGKYHTG